MRSGPCNFLSAFINTIISHQFAVWIFRICSAMHVLSLMRGLSKCQVWHVLSKPKAFSHGWRALSDVLVRNEGALQLWPPPAATGLCFGDTQQMVMTFRRREAVHASVRPCMGILVACDNICLPTLQQFYQTGCLFSFCSIILCCQFFFFPLTQLEKYFSCKNQ